MPSPRIHPSVITHHHLRQYLRACVAALLLLCPATPAMEGTAFVWFPGNSDGIGIWTVDIATGQMEQIWDGGTVGGAFVSPDGRQVAFAYRNKLHIMNNDGTDVRTPLDERFAPDRGQFSWTTNGIFWSEKPDIYRYDIATGTFSRLLHFDTTRTYPGKGYYGSLDGRRAWCYMEVVTPETPSNGHGDQVYAEFNEDFTDADLAIRRGVGYGHFLTIDGEYRFQGFGDIGAFTSTRFTDGVIVDTIDIRVPNNATIETRSGFSPCMNRNEYVLLRTDEANGYTLWVFDWTSETEEPVPVAAPPGGAYGGSMWMGQLPDPHAPVGVGRGLSVMQPEAGRTSPPGALVSVLGRRVSPVPVRAVQLVVSPYRAQLLGAPGAAVR
ncbi:MAG: hypothetical protein GF331_11530 [Chitinivibrionales bacterium]|nr:hypothetical protein [Chitinivibrionales bacterium]